MNKNFVLKTRWKTFYNTIARFPLTILLLIASTVTNAVAINVGTDDFYFRLEVSLILGASAYAVCQLLCERYFDNPVIRYCFMGSSIVISVLYYLLIRNTNLGEEVGIRTIVIFFILLIAFLWIPVIKSRFHFNQSFMAAFKGFFTAVFFSGILFLGIVLVLRVTEMLIFRISEKSYAHSANIIFMLFAPVFFLSLIPYYSVKRGKKITEKGLEDESGLISFLDEQSTYEKTWNKLLVPGRFLSALVSYIIIPVTAVFTIILLLYIIINITGKFWMDNLMEPLLLSYSITVIIVYLLASSIDNTLTRWFRIIFPKLLVPVVLFQTLSSILKIGETGITFGRYFIIAFGLFATIAGILFCVVPVRKNGMIAPILIIMSLITIIPPIDAFTISRINQTDRLEKALKRNDMLQGDKLIPKTEVPEKDKKIIIASAMYLGRMGYTKKIPWLKTFSESYDLKETFGFVEVLPEQGNNISLFVERNKSKPIPVKGYDYLEYMNIYDQNTNSTISSFKKEGKKYTLQLETVSGNNQDIILKRDKEELLRFEMKKIYNKFPSNTKTSVDTDKVTFTKENKSAIITVVAERINVNQWEGGRNQSADIYLLVGIK